MVSMFDIYKKFGFTSALQVLREDKDTQHYLTGYYHGMNNNYYGSHTEMWLMGYEDARGDLEDG